LTSDLQGFISAAKCPIEVLHLRINTGNGLFEFTRDLLHRVLKRDGTLKTAAEKKASLKSKTGSRQTP
jgi:hypothetical protein